MMFNAEDNTGDPKVDIRSSDALSDQDEMSMRSSIGCSQADDDLDGIQELAGETTDTSEATNDAEPWEKIAIRDQTSTDYSSSLTKHFPKLNQRGLEMLMDMPSEDQALMCSTTIERNEIYQQHYQYLREYETKLIKGLFLTEQALWFDTDDLVSRVERKVSEDQKFQKIQSRLLKLRIRRIHHETKATTSQKPELPPHPVTPGRDGAKISFSQESPPGPEPSGSSSLIYPRI
ncbi:hypothetical protein PTTG_29290 [Puccinia triticina 1-1 BBBD Race 1]|uniref:Uncharacterized protein n=1 Tax=Puccinia triticina (isolate 1-1 / race 1 (BBBD)) TaxID=630390 RepID=A0A180G523_PUCT1|nr:hypothetical protein PTTG_29290 [Puccinia triticina 1-1 BBBD Race 1]